MFVFAQSEADNDDDDDDDEFVLHPCTVLQYLPFLSTLYWN